MPYMDPLGVDLLQSSQQLHERFSLKKLNGPDRGEI